MKRILVVGGSHGIGKEIVNQLVAENQIINFSRTRPDLDHNNLRHFEIDILNSELPDIDELDSIIYCPGSINLKPIGILKEEDFLNDFNINVMGIVKTVKKYLKALKTSNNASMVFFGTVAVGQGMPFHASISVAKAGVQALGRSLAAELAPNVRINCIAPSITDTPLAGSILRNEKSRERIAERHPLNRIINPKEIAALASFLVSDNAKSISGQTYGVDAGMSTIKL